MVAYAWQRDSLIILQLINILNPYGSKLSFSSRDIVTRGQITS